MTTGICLISEGTTALERFGSALSQCGLTVWRCASAQGFAENSLSETTLCMIVDMPGERGLALLETLREAGKGTPAILVCDAGEMPPERVNAASVLDVLQEPVDMRALLGWIECICVASMALDREQMLQAKNLGAGLTVTQFARAVPRAVSEIMALRTGTRD